MSVSRWRAESILDDENLIRQIHARFEQGNRLGVIHGAPLIGKTSLVRAFAAWEDDYELFDDGIFFVDEMSQFMLRGEAVEGPHLIVIEGGEALDGRSIAEIEDYLVAVRMSNVIVTVRHVPGFRYVPRFELELTGYGLSDVGQIVRHVMGEVPDRYIEALWRRTAGHPVAIVNSIRLVDQKHLTWDELFNYFDTFSRLGILGPDGKPASSNTERAIFRDIGFVNADLIDRVGRDPQILYSITPRTFEEVVAELLSRQGYSVQLTPPSKDGGFDMFAAKRDGLGEFLFLVECKQYSPDRRVGVHVVRSLHGVLKLERATAAAVVTTSYFTRGAREFQSQLRHEMKLHDYVALRRWLDRTQDPGGLTPH